MNYTDVSFYKTGAMPDKDILTMAFVNIQPLTSVYDTDTGFSKGTIFPNLDKPLKVGGNMR
ncbi:MAG: spore coat associated protein CotJA [Clostridia bacterium]|nr:spore coat associated protein CotJA [Clostridia bacterium]